MSSIIPFSANPRAIAMAERCFAQITGQRALKELKEQLLQSHPGFSSEIHIAFANHRRSQLQGSSPLPESYIHEQLSAIVEAGCTMDDLYSWVRECVPNPGQRRSLLERLEDEQMKREIIPFDWGRLKDEATGVLITGSAGAAKTSIAKWLAGEFTRNDPAQLIVLDPHANLNNWDSEGFPVLGYDDDRGYGLIEESLYLLAAELRRRQSMKDCSAEPKWLVIADELTGCLGQFLDRDKVVQSINDIGCQGRKYKIELIGIAHSPNTDSLGLSASERANYTMIGARSGVDFLLSMKSAIKHPMLRKRLSGIPYRCAVAIGGEILYAVHPTHGHHTEYRKRGMAPKGIRPPELLPFTPDSEIGRFLLDPIVPVRCPEGFIRNTIKAPSNRTAPVSKQHQKTAEPEIEIVRRRAPKILKVRTNTSTSQEGRKPSPHNPTPQKAQGERAGEGNGEGGEGRKYKEAIELIESGTSKTAAIEQVWGVTGGTQFNRLSKGIEACRSVLSA